MKKLTLVYVSIVTVLMLTLVAVSGVIVYAVVTAGPPREAEVTSLDVISYPIRDDYSSYSEVVADKEAFNNYKDEYYGKMLRYLSYISKTEGDSASNYMEVKLPYDIACQQIVDEFNRVLATFEPTEEDKLKSKEDLMNYMLSVASVSPEMNAKSAIYQQTKKAIEDYNNGVITIDEALYRTRAVRLLKRSYEATDYPRQIEYEIILSKFNMSTWFNIEDFIAEHGWTDFD